MASSYTVFKLILDMKFSWLRPGSETKQTCYLQLAKDFQRMQAENIALEEIKACCSSTTLIRYS
jgi:hypothetical protein